MIMPETLVEVKVESSRSLLPGRAGLGLCMLSPWQTGVQQCTPGMSNEVVIGGAMCRQLPENAADDEVDATCHLQRATL